MKNQAQVKTAITSLRDNTHSAGQARRLPYRLVFALIIIALALSTGGAWAKPDAAWSFTGSMSVGRFSFAATMLQNGKVLVAGGVPPGGSATNSADLYDPATRTFTPTGNMHKARFGFSATRLQNGKVLVAGGGTDTELVADPPGGTPPATSTLPF